VHQSLIASLALLAVAAGAAPKDDLLAADRAFSALSLEKGSHTAFLAYVTDDVRLFDGAHPPLIGKAAVAAYYATEEKADPAYSKRRLEWMPEEAEVSPDGVLGWTRGKWVFSGPAGRLTGYYVTEWRRQSDGTYKVCLDIGSADRPK
jgi:ketosteroid isomerase-like protein